MHLFEHVGALYVGGIMKPAWVAFEERPYERQAIELFLHQYAYERLGASADYSRVATEAIRSSPDLAPERVWVAFQGLVDGGVNPKLNPLAHTQTEARLSCLLCALRQGSSYRNLITTARDALAEGQVERVHTEIRNIRGVGTKIASFFLREREQARIGQRRHVVLRGTDRAPKVHLHPSFGRPCLCFSASRGIRGSAQGCRQRLGITSRLGEVCWWWHSRRRRPELAEDATPLLKTSWGVRRWSFRVVTVS